MRIKTATAWTTTFALLLFLAPVAAIAQDPGARLEGLVLGIDGRPAADHTIHLIDDEGEARAETTTTSDGMYTFRDVPAGQYALGIESPSGEVAPVAAAPVKVQEGELQRRDLKMLNADSTAVQQAATAHYGFASWFSALGVGAKAGVVVAIAAATAGVVSVATDDDDEDQPSPTSAR